MERRDESCLFYGYRGKVKYEGFELGLPSSFPMMITITLQGLYKNLDVMGHLERAELTNNDLPI